MITEGIIEYEDIASQPIMSMYIGTLPKDAIVKTFSVCSSRADWKHDIDTMKLASSSSSSSNGDGSNINNDNKRPSSYLIFSDPYCSKLSRTLKLLDEAQQENTKSIIAGGITARNKHAPQTLAIKDRILPSGSLIGIRLGGTIGLQTSLAKQGSSPLSDTIYEITNTNGKNAITELNSMSALDIMSQAIEETATDYDRHQINKNGMLCGLLQKESQTMLVKQVTGYRPQSGSFVLAGANVNVGDSVQFFVQANATIAEKDMELTFQRFQAERWITDHRTQILAVLQISSIARGASLYDGKANVDHSYISQLASSSSDCGGFFSNGEIASNGIQMKQQELLLEQQRLQDDDNVEHDDDEMVADSSCPPTYIHGFASIAAVICEYSNVDDDDTNHQESGTNDAVLAGVLNGTILEDECWN